ncbi:CPBP family intramembrane glutamate endopeptidase, partial [Saccharopolyspora kobensis]
MRAWLAPARPGDPAVVTDRRERKAITIELVVVFAVTLGMSGLQSLLSLLDALLRPEPLADQHAAINVPRADLGLLDMLQQLTNVARLIAWGALGAYLLWRGGIALWRVG